MEAASAFGKELGRVDFDFFDERVGLGEHTNITYIPAFLTGE